MKKIIYIISIILVIAIYNPAQILNSKMHNNDISFNDQSKTITVPEGKCKPVLLDGIITSAEWDDALKAEIHDRVDLLLKVNAGHLFLGLKFKDAAGVIVDLWLTSDNKTIYQLHSSGQIGEAVFNLPAKEDTIRCTNGFTPNWDANEIKSDQKKKAKWKAASRPGGMDGYRKVLYPSDGKEFQIVLSKFSSNSLKLRFKSGDPEGIIIYPDNSTLLNTNNWVNLVLPAEYLK